MCSTVDVSVRRSEPLTEPTNGVPPPEAFTNLSEKPLLRGLPVSEGAYGMGESSSVCVSSSFLIGGKHISVSSSSSESDHWHGEGDAVLQRFCGGARSNSSDLVSAEKVRFARGKYELSLSWPLRPLGAADSSMSLASKILRHQSRSAHPQSSTASYARQSSSVPACPNR